MPGIATGAGGAEVAAAGRGRETVFIAEFAAGWVEGSEREIWGLAAGTAWEAFSRFAVDDEAESTLELGTPSSSAASWFPCDAVAARLAGLPGAGLASAASLAAADSGVPATVCADRLPML